MLQKSLVYLLLLLGLSVADRLWLARDAGSPSGEPRAARDGACLSAGSHSPLPDPLPDVEGAPHARLTCATAASRASSADTADGTACAPLTGAADLAVLPARERPGVNSLTATGSATRYSFMSLQL